MFSGGGGDLLCLSDVPVFKGLFRRAELGVKLLTARALSQEPELMQVGSKRDSDAAKNGAA
jgi:hypothetical protein